MKISLPIIEYNIIEHCNLKCVNCDHASPLMPKTIVARDCIIADLQALATVLRADEIKVIGGEPLLHPDLPEVLQAIRQSDVADAITLVTNGTLLHRMDIACWSRIDRLRVSLYPGIRQPLSLPEIEQRCRIHGVEFTPIPMGSFRHTLLDHRIEDPAFVTFVRDHCEMPVVNHSHTVRNGRYYKCSPSAFTVDRLRRQGIEYDHEGNSVALHDNPVLATELADFLRSNTPMPACSYCLGTSGLWSEHRQASSVKQKEPAGGAAPEAPWDLLAPEKRREWMASREMRS